MRAIIRLQNHGCHKHPYWWIVVQGSYTNVKGRFIEHIGYYIPRRTKTVQRSIVLNKPRIRYWLAVGAQTSSKVQRMLSYIDYMPKPLPGFGAKYTYERPPKTYNRPPNPDAKRLGAMRSQYARQKNLEEMVALEREVRTQAEIDKQASLNKDELDVELVESDIEDENLRTKTFHDLRYQFIELEKDVKKLNIRKREILFRKMNKLAGQGLVEQKLKGPDVNIEGKGGELYGTTAKERIEKSLKFAKLLEIKRKQFEKSIQDQEMLKPITQDDYVNYVIEHSEMSGSKAKRESEDLFAAASEAGVQITKQDAYMNVQKLKNLPKNIKDFKNYDKKDFILPTKGFITPFPDIWDFDPAHYYDTKLSPLQNDNPNKAYVTGTDVPPAANYKAHRYRYKQNKGRKTPVRVNFSTTNGLPFRTSIVAHDNLTAAYTGLMKKISSSW